VDAALTLDMVLAQEAYFHGRADSIKADESTTSFLPSTLDKIYLIRRVHFDTQIAALFQKHDASRNDKNNIEVLDENSGFNIKHRNSYERRGRKRKRNYFIGDDIENSIFFAVWHGGIDMDTAINNAVEKYLIHDLEGNRRLHFDKMKRLVRVQRENFQKNSSVFTRLLAYVKKEQRSRAYDRLDSTFQKHKQTLIGIAEDIRNYHLVDDDYVLLLPSKCEYKNLYEYLNKLMDRNQDGDDERIADMEELGWSFDDDVRTKAMVTRLSCDIHNNEESKGREEQQKENERTNDAEMDEVMEQMKRRNEGFDISDILGMHMP